MKNGRAETSLGPGTSSLSTILGGKNNVALITSDKQLTRKKKKYEKLSRTVFEMWIYIHYYSQKTLP